MEKFFWKLLKEYLKEILETILEELSEYIPGGIVGGMTDETLQEIPEEASGKILQVFAGFFRELHLQQSLKELLLNKCLEKISFKRDFLKKILSMKSPKKLF